MSSDISTRGPSNCWNAKYMAAPTTLAITPIENASSIGTASPYTTTPIYSGGINVIAPRGAFGVK